MVFLNTNVTLSAEGTEREMLYYWGNTTTYIFETYILQKKIYNKYRT